ncbi:MAG: ABC transporter permease subunit [Isosphaeraceae bacterium]|nr:ABC transporter permease subunit [Isosphaeraceae bacterium]
MRLAPGPVFVFECITSARRWQVYAVRALFVTSLLAAMIVIRLSQVEANMTTIQGQAQVGESYFYALIGTQLALVMLAAPAFTAGAICLDRARGALAHVLVTDLTDNEIVLGKLGARLVPVISLVGCAFPLMSLGALLGGIDPVALGMAFLVALAVAVLSCALALAISVWATKTHEVLMAVYAFWTVELLFQPIWQMLAMSGTGLPGPPWWALRLNPYWLSFSPYLAPNQASWTDFALFLGGSLSLSAALAAISIVWLRPVTARQAGRSSGTRKVVSQRSFLARLWQRLPGPSLDGNPVLWREWHRSRPSRLTRLLWWAYFGSLSYGGAYSVSEIYQNGVRLGPNLGIFVILLGVGLGLLLLSVTAASSLSEERTRGSLDVLLATPLATRTILWGKWWGAYRVVPLLAFWPAVAMAAFAFGKRSALPVGTPAGFYSTPYSSAAGVFAVVLMALIVLVHGAALTSLGLALATWVPRQGRAVGFCVAAYVMVAIGWMILIIVLFPNGPKAAEPLGSLSPVFASVNLCEQMVFRHNDMTETFAVTSVWLLLVAGFAAGLYVLTLATFDRCLGRTSDWNDELWFGPELPRYRRYPWTANSALTER